MKRALGLAAAAALAALACGALACSALAGVDWDRVVVSGEGGAADASLTPDDACKHLAIDLCQRLSECSSFALGLDFGDQATCVARTALACDADLGAPGSSRTPAGEAACGDALATLGCDDLLTVHYPTACRPAPGTLATGAPCGDNAQCQSAHCEHAADAICGTCSGVSPGIAGATCQKISDCETGLLCIGATCTAFGAADAACGTAPCSPSLACVNGRCQEATAIDGTCSATANACDVAFGDFCDTTTGKCAETSLADGGDACFTSPAAADGALCRAGGKCNTNGPASVCTAAAADGAPCDDQTPCLAPAVCQAGTCTLPNPSSCR